MAGPVLELRSLHKEIPRKDREPFKIFQNVNLSLRDGEFVSAKPLRDSYFDLQKRLFRYPMSYMVYSDLFQSLPAPVLDRVYRRLYDVLSGKDRSPKYAALSAADRRAVIEILRDTKPNLPDYWEK